MVDDEKALAKIAAMQKANAALDENGLLYKPQVTSEEPLDDAIDRIVRDAVLAEREACANVAEDGYKSAGVACSPIEIARRIRARK